MKVGYFDWDFANEDHMARHGVHPDEVEELFSGRHQVYKSREGRYVAMGHSLSGRHLMVVFELKSPGEIRVVTARDMTDREKKRFKRSL